MVHGLYIVALLAYGLRVRMFMKRRLLQLREHEQIAKRLASQQAPASVGGAPEPGSSQHKAAQRYEVAISRVCRTAATRKHAACP